MKFEEGEEGALTDSYRRAGAPALYMRGWGAHKNFDLLRLVSEVGLYYVHLAVVEKQVLAADRRGYTVM